MPVKKAVLQKALGPLVKKEKVENKTAAQRKKELGVLQGYPDDGELLKADIAKFTKLSEQQNDNVGTTHLGRACSNLKNTVNTELEKVRDGLHTLIYEDKPPYKDLEHNKKQSTSPIKLHMGPLKKVTRIMQKAAHYAICDDVESDTLRIDEVRDVLRATIEFPPSVWDMKGVGSKIIDQIDAAFHKKVVQVKNRFIEQRYPKLRDYRDIRYEQAKAKGMPYAVSNALKADIQYLWENSLNGRDAFYRDIQLLVQLDSTDYPNGTKMAHTLLEIQLVSSDLYGAKVTKSADDESGHQMYRLIRTVMERCELNYWTSQRGGAVKLQNYGNFYPDPKAEYWARFTTALSSMYDLYRAKTRRYKPYLQTAIDDSTWYKNAAARG